MAETFNPIQDYSKDTKEIEDAYNFLSNKRAYVYSNGCVPNRLEGKKIELFLRSNGWIISKDHINSNLIIFNTCAYSGLMIDESIKMIRKYRKEKKRTTEIIITGCLPKIDMMALKKIFDGKILDISEFGKKFNSSVEINSLYVSDWIIDNLESAKHDIYHIVTSTGCLGKCSYCSIKKARGLIKSKPIKHIIKEFKDAAYLGFKKFILWGDDLGAYGKDISTNLIALLEEIIHVDYEYPDFYISLHRLNAQWLVRYFDEFMELLKSNKIKLIYTPIQSGSPKILRLMRRNYDIEKVKKYIRILKQKFPAVKIKTDIMIGFPTENEEDFKETLRLIEEIEFDDLAVFKYYEIIETKAYDMEGKINEETKNERTKILLEKFINSRFFFGSEYCVYWLRDRKKNTIGGPFCPNCYDSLNLLVQLATLKGLRKDTYFCPKCNSRLPKYAETIFWEEEVSQNDNLYDLEVYIRARQQLSNCTIKPDELA